MSNTKLVRVNGMSDEEWRRLKAKAAMLNKPLGELAADALRAVLKGAKP